MTKIIDLNDWQETDSFIEPSGRSEKHWLFNPANGQIGLFKYPKPNPHSICPTTFEHVSEHLASQIASKLYIPCCKIDIGTYNNRIGCLSYLVHDYKKESLVDGVRLLEIDRPNYDAEKMMDKSTNELYSIDMILESLFSNDSRNQFVKVAIFDFLIGNSDRHHSNWAIIIYRNSISLSLAPLYDNGSSLCCYVNEEDIPHYITDKNRFKSLTCTKSKSAISIENIKRPRHSDVVRYIIRNNYISKEYLENIVCNFNDECLTQMIDEYSGIITCERQNLIKIFLREKVRILETIINE